MKKKLFNLCKLSMLTPLFVISILDANANITLDNQVKITDYGLHFDGIKVANGAIDNGTDVYDYHFGPQISAHGDSIKTYKDYVFMTWYKGGKHNRQVMLTRYNMRTGTIRTIEFPHRHTGFIGQRHIGESHNTIAVEISPINGTIHMLYDMHAYSSNKPTDGSFSDDYFRYSFSVPGTADVPDEEFTLDKFVKDESASSQGPNDYKHLTLTGNIDHSQFSGLTYPTFFANTDGTLLVYMRKGGNNNGGYVFSHYDANSQKWSDWNQFNVVNAKSHGNDYNWGLYGSMKYINGKLRVGFQQRANREDRYVYQNGVYYAYSNKPDGDGSWNNHKGVEMTFPLVNSDEIKVFEPGDYITHTELNSVHIVQDFDWTVTENEDIHIISKVRSNDKNRPDYQEVYLHSYKPNGSGDFIISSEFSGATNIYTAGDNVYIIGLNSDGRPYIEMAPGGTNDFKRVYEATEGKQFSHGKVHIKDGKLYYYLMERSTTASRPLYLQVIDLDIDLGGPEGFVFSSNENEVVEIDGVMDVAFGAHGEFKYLYGQSSNITCDKETFGNPIKNKTKRCYTKMVSDPSVKVSFGSHSVTLQEGYDKLVVGVSATSAIVDGVVKNVELYVDDNFVRSERKTPFVWGESRKKELLGLEVGTHKIQAIAVDDRGFIGEASIDVIVETASNL